MTGGGGGGAARQTYIQIGTSTANFSRAGGRRGVLTVETGLDVADADLFARAGQSAPEMHMSCWKLHSSRRRRSTSGTAPRSTRSTASPSRSEASETPGQARAASSTRAAEDKSGHLKGRNSPPGETY